MIPKEKKFISEVDELSGQTLQRADKVGYGRNGYVEQKNHIIKLSISNLKLEYIPESIENLEELKILYMGGNYLTKIPDSILTLRNLEVLEAWENRIELIPKDIGILNKVWRLHLAGNKITELPESIGDLPMKKLYLKHNNVCYVPESIGNWIRLDVFGLPLNNLSSLPETINGWKNVRVISLWQNKLKALPDVQLNVKELRLNNNFFTEVPPRVYEIQQLRKLWLNSNQLTEIPEIPKGQLKNLWFLNLQNNFLSSLPRSLQQLPNLRDLRLSGNLFESYPDWLDSLEGCKVDKSAHKQQIQQPDYIGVKKYVKYLEDHHLPIEHLVEIKHFQRYLENEKGFSRIVKAKADDVKDFISQTEITPFALRSLFLYFSWLQDFPLHRIIKEELENYAQIMNINLQDVNRLSQESQTVTSLLTLDEEEKKPSRILSQPQRVEPRIEGDEWEAFIAELDKISFEAVKILIKSSKPKIALEKFARSQNRLPETLLEAINELALEFIGDLIVDQETYQITEDNYKEKLLEISFSSEKPE
ncbi:MAG: leucine-rich repeat domain-containing protein [Candidatus Heimdallarchaeota archaeon]|nr:MAG: leucine-rich repeat domain-containing protein [Candidatus Heimdallarchaeota archaeon]